MELMGFQPVLSPPTIGSQGYVHAICTFHFFNYNLLHKLFFQEVMEDKQLRDQLYAAVMTLPDKQAKRIYARFYLGMTPIEIAKAEKVDVSRVRDSIRRGLKNLSKLFR